MQVLFYQDARGDWRWRLTSRNNKIVANCGEGYRRRIDCQRIAVKLFAHLNPKGL